MKATDRTGALSGAVFVLLGLAGNGLSQQPGQPDRPTGEETLKSWDWYAGNPVAQVAVSMELFGFLAWMVFVAYLFTRARDAGWLATAALVGGIAAISIKIGSLAPTATVYLLRDELSPESAHILGYLSGTGFMAHVLAAGFFVAAAAAAAMKAGAVGRIIGWAGIAFGVINMAVIIIGGVNMDRSFYAPSFLLVLLWILVASLWLAFRRDRSGEAPAAGVGKPAGFLSAGPTVTSREERSHPRRLSGGS
ncbi:hypothetical protein ASG92_25130 [Arthrobacter sp. Soil736]|uniref:hypothetical protein n=1 Tax=Arthrobacter sp. Soil736 TaxID=1736395 RepID=UPI0006F6660C|nr:hypothetical protein [Arthrobacter sp. Soil736]KRE52954.1 hypothetical protein ASG92_25130 [Arthrobacter sp. Soil736]